MTSLAPELAVNDRSLHGHAGILIPAILHILGKRGAVGEAAEASHSTMLGCQSVPSLNWGNQNLALVEFLEWGLLKSRLATNYHCQAFTSLPARPGLGLPEQSVRLSAQAREALQRSSAARTCCPLNAYLCCGAVYNA